MTIKDVVSLMIASPISVRIYDMTNDEYVWSGGLWDVLHCEYLEKRIASMDAEVVGTDDKRVAIEFNIFAGGHRDEQVHD